jgi:serine/threonine protein kinase
MAIAVKCPNISCGKLLSFPPELSGQTVKCDRCRHPVLLPANENPDASTILMPQDPEATVVNEAQTPPAPPPPRPSDSLVGTRLAHFEIIERIAVGAMGAMYRARDLSLDRIVALKMITDELAQRDHSYVARFLQEARLAARIEHPNVLPIYFIGCEGERLFIATQYVEGGTLGDRLRERGPITPVVAVRIVREVALALAAAHAQHVIHRDIKPSNIMLLSHGHILVTDFGLAKPSENAVTETAVGSLVGTPAYMSPEQCQGLEPDQRSDLYCLGATFYHLLTGATPYGGDNFMAVIRQHLDAPVPDPRTILPDLAENICSILRRLMAKDRDDRYRTAEDVVRDLNGILGLRRQADLTSTMPVPKSSPPTPLPRPASESWQRTSVLRYLTVLVPTMAVPMLCLLVWIAGLRQQVAVSREQLASAQDDARCLRADLAQYEAARGLKSAEFRAALKALNSITDTRDYEQAKSLCAFMKETFSQSPDVRSYLDQKHRNLILLADSRRSHSPNSEGRNTGPDATQLAPNPSPFGPGPAETAIPGLSISHTFSLTLAPALSFMEGTPTSQRLRQAEEELSKLHPPALPPETLKAFREYLNVTKEIMSGENLPARN